MKHLSYELPHYFTEYCLEYNLKDSMALVEECFDYFPKDSDSITKVILEGLEEGAEDQRHKMFFKYLLKHLEILYLNWARAQA